MNDKAPIKFTLIVNARDSLRHAVGHLTKEGDLAPGDIKRVIQDIAQAVELLLKERLQRLHPAFVWEQIDQYPDLSARTVTTDVAVKRLLKITGVVLTEKSQKTILQARKLRNSIEHFEFTLDLKEAQGIAARLLSFIFDFSKTHLQMDFEDDFRKDKRWHALIQIVEFSEAHSEIIEARLRNEGIPYRECPSCAKNTFNENNSECALCGHCEERVKCEICDEDFWESETETVREIVGDEESGGFEYRSTACLGCREDQERQE